MADDEANTEASPGRLKAGWLRLKGWVFKDRITPLWILFWRNHYRREARRARLRARWVKFKAWVFKPRIFLGGFVWCLAFPALIVLKVDKTWIKNLLENFWINEQSVISPIVSLFAFFAATFGLFLAGRRTQEVLRQNNITLEQKEVALEQNKIIEQGQVIERFTRAVEQLGHDNQAVRVGGLYGLERIAEESPKERRQAFSMLAGFVRSRGAIKYQKDEDGNIKKANGEPVPELSKPRSEKIDIETAVKILANIVKPEERLDKNWGRSIDLSATDLRGLQLQERDLQRFDFRNALLSDINNRIILSRADLTFAFLFDADLTGAVLYFANLTNATLSYADLTDAYLDSANLTSANLESAEDLTQEQLTKIRYKEGEPPRNLPEGLVLPEEGRNIIKPDAPETED